MKQFPVMTAVMGGLIVIAAAVGGAVVIWGQPGALSFQEYLDDLKVFALAVAGLGGARGLIAAAQHLAEGFKPPAPRAAPPAPIAFTQPGISSATTSTAGSHGTSISADWPFWTATGNPASTPATYSAKKPPMKKPAARKPAVKKPPPRGK